MPTKKYDKLQMDFPAGMSLPALRALAGAGYTRLDQLSKVAEADLLKLHGMGPKGMRILRAALKARGLSFARPGKTEKSSQPKTKASAARRRK
jgi:hypothetical protein